MLQPGREVGELSVIFVVSEIRLGDRGLDDRSGRGHSRSRFRSQRHRRGERHRPGTVGKSPPPGIATDGLQDHSISRHGQGDCDRGLNAPRGHAPGREAIAAHIEHDDRGDGGDHQAGDHAAPTAEPDQRRVEPRGRRQLAFVDR